MQESPSRADCPSCKYCEYTIHSLHPRVDTRNKLHFLHDFGEQGSPISTKKLQNKVDTARHGLILRQHEATAYTELLEAYFLQYQTIFE